MTLTIEDIRNPERKSGFEHVGTSLPTAGKGKVYYQAYGPRSTAAAAPGNSRGGWRGTTRKTAEDAAQDYCDFVNAGPQPARPPRQPSKPRLVVDLRRLVHKGAPSVPRKPRKARGTPVRERLGYVYLIVEEPARTFGKIGWAGTPMKRISALQAGNHRLLSIMGVIRGTERDERELHAEFATASVGNEWFRLTDALLSEFDLEGVSA